MIFEKVSALIADQFGVDQDSITMDTSFGLEEMGEEDLSQITTVGDLVNLLQNRTGLA